MFVVYIEWLRPLARASSNRAIFTPQSDPDLVQYENSLSNNNRMYMMKVRTHTHTRIIQGGSLQLNHKGLAYRYTTHLVHAITLCVQVIGADCSDNEMWTATITEGARALGDTPHMCLFGTEDGVFPVATCQEAARILGAEQGACHPLEGAGHLCMLEAHEKVSEILQQFISQFS